MKQIKWSRILKYLALFLLNVLVVLVYYYKIPKDYGMEYMFSFVPLYAVFYGIFSRLLTNSTLFPMIILFVTFWYSYGGYMITEDGFFNSLFNGSAFTDLLMICALPGMYCTISIIPSLFIKLIAWLVKIIKDKMRKQNQNESNQSGDG